MTYRGRMQGGVVVLDEPAGLADGTVVTVQPVTPQPSVDVVGPVPSPMAKSLLELAGRAKGLPKDAARNHDHYLYGTPKR